MIPSELGRYPRFARDPLQAWDAADELLVEQLRGMDLAGKRILILGDEFGALSCALEGLEITTYTDSYVSAQGILANSQGRITPVSDLALLPGECDLAVIRIPKNLAFFEDQLAHLSQRIKPGGEVICGYRIKYQTKSSFDLLERWIGPTHTSLAKKKSRLIFARRERPSSASPYPRKATIDGFSDPFLHHSNLFSREKLDVGTRFFLEHIPAGNWGTILDLGCANGVVGIAARQKHPEANVIFSDDSWMAVESARANYRAYFPDHAARASFRWLNCFEGQAAASVDLVLCNPPFHQGNTVGDFIARQMFEDARRTLKPGGRIRVIGNSHLHYEGVLGRLFGQSERVAKNSKFTIVDAFKS